MTTALIDGDIIVYRMSWAVQKTHYTYLPLDEFFEGKKKAKDWYKEMVGGDPDFDNDKEWLIVDNLEPWSNCKFLVDSCISQIMEAVGAENKMIFLSPKHTFRHDIAVTAPYKAGRPPPPFYKDKVATYLIERYGAECGNKVEADDLLGMMQDTDTVIVSIDKDLLMIPGKHYNFVKDEFVYVDLLAADVWFFAQLLAGDRTDNINGLKGIGIKTALKIVERYTGDHEGLVRTIKDMYNAEYAERGEDVMIEMAQLVYILRRGDKPGTEQWRKLLLLEKQ